MPWNICSWERFDVAIDDGTPTFIETMAIRPGEPSRIYASGFFGRLHYSSNGGDEWNVVMNAAGEPMLPDVGTGRANGDFVFAYSPSVVDVVYLGTNGGHLWRTMSSATTAAGWVKLNTPRPAGSGRIAAIAVPSGNPDTVVIGYQIAGDRALWRGAVGVGGVVQWTDVGGSPADTLPLVPINALLIDPINSRSIFAATNVGMFTTDDGGASWRLFSEGLPRIRIVDLQLRTRNRMLYAAAYGRGIFRRRI